MKNKESEKQKYLKIKERNKIYLNQSNDNEIIMEKENSNIDDIIINITEPIEHKNYKDIMRKLDEEREKNRKMNNSYLKRIRDSMNSDEKNKNKLTDYNKIIEYDNEKELIEDEIKKSKYLDIINYASSPKKV